MANDDERRKVARKLREAASYYESMERDVDFYPVESTLGLKPAGETAYTPESVRSLADLIEPICDTAATHTDATATRDVSQCRRSDVDREALLALADDMDRHADMAAGHIAYAARFDFAGWARRIREALGEGES